MCLFVCVNDGVCMSVLMQAWVLETKVDHCVQLFFTRSFCVLESTILASLIWVSSFATLLLGKSDSGFKSPPDLQISIEPQLCLFVQHY